MISRKGEVSDENEQSPSMSRDDPRVRLRHMLAYATEAVTLMRGRRRADLDIDRAGESSH